MQRCLGSVLVWAPEPGRRAQLAALLRVGGFSVATACDPLQLLQRLRWPGLADVLVATEPPVSPEAQLLVHKLSAHPQLAALPILLLSAEPPPPALAARFVARACAPESELSVLRVVAQLIQERRRTGRPLWEPLGREEEEVRSGEGDEPFGPSPS